MNNELWRVLSPLLDQLLDVEVAERDELLKALGRKDARAAEELASMLEDADAVLRSAYLEQAVDAPVADGDRLSHAAQGDGDGSTMAGRSFGPYTLERLLGRGGMGAVWLAHRSDGRYEANVAVKLLNAALIGKAAEQRFRREGEVL